MSHDLSNDISTNAAGPKRVTGDEGSYTAHPLKDQIEADRYLSAKEATAKGKFPLKMQKLIPPGTT